MLEECVPHCALQFEGEFEKFRSFYKVQGEAGNLDS
jgi:hypothetical protein